MSLLINLKTDILTILNLQIYSGHVSAPTSNTFSSQIYAYLETISVFTACTAALAPIINQNCLPQPKCKSDHVMSLLRTPHSNPHIYMIKPWPQQTNSYSSFKCRHFYKYFPDPSLPQLPNDPVCFSSVTPLIIFYSSCLLISVLYSTTHDQRQGLVYLLSGC